jgi:hypothetical protein
MKLGLNKILLIISSSSFITNTASALSTSLCEKLYGATPVDNEQVRRIFESGNTANVTKVGAPSDVKFFLIPSGELVRVDLRTINLYELNQK